MDKATEKMVSDAVERWANRHADPDRPVFSGQYSPRQIARELRLRTDVGRKLLLIIEHWIKRHSLDEVLQTFDGLDRPQLLSV